MSFYELRAEGNRYFHFQHRTVKDTLLHFHGAVEFLFAENEPQEVTVNGIKRILQPGEACFCDSFIPHAYKGVSHSTAYVLLGDKEYFKDVFASFGDKRPPTFFRFDNFNLLAVLYELCAKKWENDGGRYETFGGAVKILLSEIAESTPFVDKRIDKQSALMSDLLQYVEEHLREDLSLRTIANVFGYSHEHLSRILHKYLPENWNVYVNRMRARYAHTILKKSPDRSVLEILYESGFDSPNTFYRAYKKEFHKKPRA